MAFSAEYLAHPDADPVVVPPGVMKLPSCPMFEGLGPAFADAPKYFDEYMKAVAAAVEGWSTSERHEVVCFLMRVFQAANFTGELCEEEARAVEPATCHLSGLPLTPQKDETQVGKTAAEAHQRVLDEHAKLVASRSRHLRRLLAVDGEVVSVVVAEPAVLLAARGIARTLAVTDIWRLRVLYRHLQCMEHHSHTLFIEIAESVDALRETEDISVLVELSFVQNAFHQEEFASSSAFKAVHLSGLQLEESAMVGVRTRYQKIKFVQSLLKAKSAEEPVPLPEKDRARSQPPMIDGEKDGHDLYDRPREDIEKEALEEPPLLLRDHEIILALGFNIRNNNPAYGLTYHQIQTYVERLLTDKTAAPFITRAMELLVRSRVELGRSRVGQRAFLQLQHFVETFAARSAESLRPTYFRTDPRFAYGVNWPSIWMLKKEYAAECFDMSLYKTALDVYEEAEDWDWIIKCCAKLDRRRRAETLAREKLEDEPDNPTYYVALGEATRDESFLWKAWELSGERMAAPMRSLARLALDREQWPKVVEYFNKAVAINPVFGGDWFSLGYACLRLGDNEQAARAFTRVCQVDPENSYAWTNLGNVLVKLKRWRAAFSAMSQALRHSRDNWRMWGNYWAVSVHLLEVQEATHALHTAIGIAGRGFVFEDSVMVEFTDMVLRFLRGELQLRDNTPLADEDFEFKPAPLVTGTDDESVGGEAMEPAAPAEEEGETEACEGFEPLFVDSDEDDGNDLIKAAAERRKADTETARATARAAYRGRVKRVFEALISEFVDNPDLYACCARVWRELDGAQEEFRFRLKEVRESKRGMWERSEEKFRRVVQALTALANVAEELATSDAKRQALEACENAVRAAADHLDSLPIYAEAEQLRLRVSRMFVRD